ncbi:chorismate synthase [Gleimia hominis]|uniref:Chorismate synthase n=1 Tax=Gleimia hominis TaxID=595468 RepID=A0ABU3IBC3_9ACTO|nr:chorismate synthase [Gleimia hominis]MDT3767678.1 chorismate synthase [Gleimia hominis]
MMRWITAGESHGEALVGIIESVPAGLAITSADIEGALARRRTGYGRGARQKFEQDRVRLLSGVRHGRTLGSPIAIEVANSEWPKWRTVMSSDPVDPKDLMIDAGTGDEREVARNKRLTQPRPGHADLPGMLKYAHEDARNVLERSSARETAMRVALGEVARQFLRQVAGIEVLGHVVQVGQEAAPARQLTLGDADAVNASDVRCVDAATAARFRAEIDGAKRSGDTVGGVVEVVAFNVPAGLGTYTQWDQRLDGQLAQALMSIQAAKSVEIGDGLTQTQTRGSRAHDEILVDARAYRPTNHAGGLEGGMSNGEPLVARVGFKPISTVPHALRTIDLENRTAAKALHQRSDTCAVVPAAVIAEAMVALVLANAVTQMFGGTTVDRARTAMDSYVRETRARLQP